MPDLITHTSKIYTDEPIITSAPEIILNSKYYRMRQIARTTPYTDNSELFVLQGEFMADHTDDYEYKGEFFKYYPTYQNMNDSQLRGYFTWRSKVRSGIVEKTSLSFVFLYIYELINQIGTSSPEDGFNKLIFIHSAYVKYEKRLDVYMQSWFRDYVIYYNLDKSYFNKFDAGLNQNAIMPLLQHEEYADNEVFEGLISASSYNITKSKLYKQYPEDTKNIVSRVYRNLSAHSKKSRNYDIYEKFFGSVYLTFHTMFSSAIFFEREKHPDTEYEINNMHKYKCKNGHWTVTRLFYSSEKNRDVGKLLKTIDYFLRIHYNLSPNIKIDKITKTNRTIIQKTIEEYEKSKIKKVVVNIDTSKLQGIREVADITRDKLITEDDINDTQLKPDNSPVSIPSDNSINADNDITQNTDIVNEVEAAFLHCLLCNKPYNDILRANNLILSVIVDTINDKLFEHFNDTVIDYNGDVPGIIEDYTEELRGLMRGGRR